MTRPRFKRPCASCSPALRGELRRFRRETDCGFGREGFGPRCGRCFACDMALQEDHLHALSRH